MKPPEFPKGWDERRISELLAHYETQSEEEAVAEDEAISLDPGQTVMEIPSRLVPAVRELAVRELIARHEEIARTARVASRLVRRRRFSEDIGVSRSFPGLVGQ